MKKVKPKPKHLGLLETRADLIDVVTRRIGIGMWIQCYDIDGFVDMMSSFTMITYAGYLYVQS